MERKYKNVSELLIGDSILINDQEEVVSSAYVSGGRTTFRVEGIDGFFSLSNSMQIEVI